MNQRIARIAQGQGLSIDIDAATEHLTTIGLADTWTDAAIANHLRTFAGKAEEPAVDLNLPPALRDPGFRASLGKLGMVDEWNRLSTTNKNLLLSRYAADQAKASTLTPLQAFEREAVTKYGAGFRTLMTATEKMRYADLCDARPKVGMTTVQTQMRDLEHMRGKLATATGMDRVNLQSMITSLETKLGLKSVA
jgi:hypothetical protein